MKSNIKVYDLDTNVKPNVATDHLTLELLLSCLLGVRHLNPTSISEDIIIYIMLKHTILVLQINFVVMIMVIRVIIASVTSLQNPGNASQVRYVHLITSSWFFVLNYII